MTQKDERGCHEISSPSPGLEATESDRIPGRDPLHPGLDHPARLAGPPGPPGQAAERRPSRLAGPARSGTRDGRHPEPRSGRPDGNAGRPARPGVTARKETTSIPARSFFRRPGEPAGWAPTTATGPVGWRPAGRVMSVGSRPNAIRGVADGGVGRGTRNELAPGFRSPLRPKERVAVVRGLPIVYL
jgi:hypothetical protein